jgi:NAD-dependent dihydropyrimidine dehydrogenase PreA subunit
MLYLFAILSMYMVLLTSSLKPKEPKFCVNCRYFVPPSDGLKLEHGKCSLFPYSSAKILVDGIIRSADYHSCSTARSITSMCDKDALRYKKKYTRKIHEKNEELEDK